MLKLYFAAVLLFVSFLSGYGQNNAPKQEKEKATYILKHPVQNSNPLYIIRVDRKKLEFQHNDENENILNQLAPEWIESLNVLNSDDAIAKHGVSGKDGVIVISLLPNALDLMPRGMRKKFK